MSLPIRIRLSISYFLIFSFAGILLCVASYWMARHSLYDTLGHELEEHIDDVHDFFLARGLSPDAPDAVEQITSEFLAKDDGKWLQIRLDGGPWTYRSRRMLITPHDLPRAAGLPVKGQFAEFGAGPKRVRTLTRAFQIDGHWVVVEAGSTLTKTDQTLAIFRNGLLIISPAIFLIAGLAGHLTSRRALNPVAAIAREAQRINDGNLQIRLPELKSNDELENLSRTLNEMLERIESGVRSVRDFTAYASHELRTPVALIRTEADLALHFHRSNREYREAIEVIGAEAVRMSSLLDSLLFLARADAGAEQVQLESVDVRSICQQSIDKWRPLMRSAQIELHSSLPEDGATVIADPRYLQRLLTILLENAAKYTLAGGSVCLSLRMETDVARFEVSDTGIGIAAEDRLLIFQRFCRGRNVQDVNAHGSGLGLALGAWIAERHGTALHVEGSLGTGSNFSFTLPRSFECGVKEQLRELNLLEKSTFHETKSTYA